jgi:diaminopimelate decarboxylase
MDIRNNKLFLGGVSAETLAAEYQTPLYVYDQAVLTGRLAELRACLPLEQVRLLYACKANTSVAVMRVLREGGAGIDAVSPGEVFLALRAGFTPEAILFTGNNASEEDFLFCLEKGVMVNLGSLAEMELYGRIAPDTEVCVRINPDVGAGHHDHCITGGPESKFGIYFDRVDEIKAAAARHRLRVTGIHAHIGSGILDTPTFLDAMQVIVTAARGFPDLEFVDFGGGIGVPYRPGQARLDLADFGRQAATLFAAFCAAYGRKLTLVLEPGRYLVCEAGTLLIRALNRKTTPAHTFVGTDSGFNHLIRPMAYGSYHQIVNASRVEGETEAVAVAGNLCESGDVFTRDEQGIKDREITRIADGDILAIMNAGAYGFSMASNYNARLLPAEVMVANGTHRLVRRRQEFTDLLRGQVL